MNQEQIERTKILLTKILALVGFLATIALLLWVVVQAVRFLPSAFESLASLAESIRDYEVDQELEIHPEKNIVNNGEAFRMTWNNLGREGTYHFSYACTEGVSVNIEGLSEEILRMQCGDELSLPETVEGLTVTIASERRRFTDVPFTISFEADDEVTFEDSVEVTVVNAVIPQANNIFTQLEETENMASVPESQEEDQEEDTDEEVATEETSDETPSTPRPSAPTQPPITYITYFPQSDPNGYTDLQVTYQGIGTTENGTFTPRGTFDSTERGAIRFEVKNIGTKTSGGWSFSATLPSGVVYTSDTQDPLKPNERALFTLGFNIEDASTRSAIAAEVFEGDDINSANNAFSWTVRID